MSDEQIKKSLLIQAPRIPLATVFVYAMVLAESVILWQFHDKYEKIDGIITNECKYEHVRYENGRQRLSKLIVLDGKEYTARVNVSLAEKHSRDEWTKRGELQTAAYWNNLYNQERVLVNIKAEQEKLDIESYNKVVTQPKCS